MTVNSKGDKNRTAGHDFNENNIQIDNFDGRQTVNISIPSEKNNDRPLVKAQRKRLNELVMNIAAASASETYKIWQQVHAEIGVSSIDEMTVNQYRTATNFLQSMLDRCKEKAENNALIALLLSNSEALEIRQQLNHYCHITFGTSCFEDLSRPQLQKALCWLDNRRQMINEGSACSGQQQHGLVNIIRSYPKAFSLTFALGMLSGMFVLSLF